jgi:hypothetical protein
MNATFPQIAPITASVYAEVAAVCRRCTGKDVSGSCWSRVPPTLSRFQVVFKPARCLKNNPLR